MARTVARQRRNEPATLPEWVPPQLTQLVDAAPEKDGWLHEIKFDGYRMMARLDRGAVKLLTRTDLDWTHKYPAIAAAVASLGTRQPRRRIVRHLSERHHLLQHDPGRVGASRIRLICPETIASDLCLKAAIFRRRHHK